jgi:GNAT superfamily N-acetyltransferase
MINFYALVPNSQRPVHAFPHAAELRLWRPSGGFPAPGPVRGRNAIWWLLAKLGLIDGGRFVELTLWIGHRMAQRLIVTPRWWRFPFMGSDDLQIGDVWTAPTWRGQGLGRAATAEAERLAADSANRLWYVTDGANEASVRLAESSGFTPVGAGVRTAPLGIRAAGRFHLTDRSMSAAQSLPIESRRSARRRDRSPAG